MLGVGEAANFPASVKAVAEWFPKRQRAFANGVFNSGTNVGVMLTFAIVWLSQSFGWQAAFVVTGALGFLWLGLWVWLYRAPAEPPLDGQHQIRHPAGLAIDVGALRKRDGSWLAVGPHWPSNIGGKTCGEGAVEHFAREARELASIVCEAADERLFHFALTPDFDAAHADHVHLEIKPATRWFIVN